LSIYFALTCLVLLVLWRNLYDVKIDFADYTVPKVRTISKIHAERSVPKDDGTCNNHEESVVYTILQKYSKYVFPKGYLSRAISKGYADFLNVFVSDTAFNVYYGFLGLQILAAIVAWYGISTKDSVLLWPLCILLVNECLIVLGLGSVLAPLLGYYLDHSPVEGDIRKVALSGCVILAFVLVFAVPVVIFFKNLLLPVVFAREEFKDYEEELKAYEEETHEVDQTLAD